MGRRRGFGLRREKRKEKEIDLKEKERGARVWAGLKAGEREKRKDFLLLKTIQTHSMQIRIQEFKFKLNHNQNKMQRQHEMQQTYFPYIYFMARYFI